MKDSPARDLKLELNKSRSYANYSNFQVRELLKGAEINAPDDKRWIVWLAAYSGMRLGEIVQLMKSDIRTDEDSGRLYIHVTDRGEEQSVKSEAGIRQVPLHKALIEAGFIEYMSTVEDRVFPSVRSKSITQWFSGFREACGIPQFNDFEQRYVFHSFRHTVVTMARAKGNQNTIVQQVIGHEKTGAGVTDRYTHGFALKDVLEVIDCLDYN